MTNNLSTLLSGWWFWLLAAVLAGLLALWWYHSYYPRWRVIRDLQSARTAADERRVFEYISRTSRVHFSAYDSAGLKLDVSQPNWLGSVHSIHFHQYGKSPIEHRLIDPSNLSVLMGE